MTLRLAIRWGVAIVLVLVAAAVIFLDRGDWKALVARGRQSEKVRPSPGPMLESARQATVAGLAAGRMRVDGDGASELPEQALLILMTGSGEVLCRVKPSELSNLSPESIGACARAGLSFFGATTPDCECDLEVDAAGALLVRIPPYVRLRVIDAESRAPLEAIAYPGSGGQREWPEPTAFGRGPTRGDLRGLICLPVEGPARQWFVGAPGYAWREVVADSAASGEGQCPLDRGGSVEITLLGWPATERPRIILSRLVESVATPVGLLPGPDADQVSRMSGIREGTYQVIVHGYIGSEPLGSATIDVQCGGTTRVLVGIGTGPELSGRLSAQIRIDIGQGWARRDWTFSLIGPGRAGLLQRLDAPGIDGGQHILLGASVPALGTYTLGDAAIGWRQAIDVRGAGDTLECQVPPPGHAVIEVLSEGGNLDPAQLSVYRRFEEYEGGPVSLVPLARRSDKFFQFTAAPGTHDVSAHADGWIAVEEVLTISSAVTTQARILMRKYSGLRVWVKDVGESEVRARLYDAEQEPMRILNTYHCVASKALQIDELLPGEYLLELTDVNGVVLGGGQRVSLRAGQLVDLVLR